MTRVDIRLLEDRSGAYLCWGQERRAIDADEFRAWAAYSGIDLVMLTDAEGQGVLIADPAQWTLIMSEWMKDEAQGDRNGLEFGRTGRHLTLLPGAQ